MDDLTHFLGLAMRHGIGPLRLLSQAENEMRGVFGDLRLSEGDSKWFRQFTERVQMDCRRLGIDCRDLAELKQAVQVLHALRTRARGGRSGEQSDFLANVLEVAIRADTVWSDARDRGKYADPEAQSSIRATADSTAVAAKLEELGRIANAQYNDFRVALDEIRRWAKTFAPPASDRAAIAGPETVEVVLVELYEQVGKLAQVAAHTVRGNQTGQESISVSEVTEMILEKVDAQMRRIGVEVIDARVGMQADSFRHEVIDSREPPPGRSDLAGSIAEVVSMGFRQGERVIRRPAVIAYKRDRS